MQVYIRTGIVLGLVGLAACSGGGATVTPSQMAGQSSAPLAGADALRLPAATAGAAKSLLSVDVGGGGSSNWIADTDYTGGWAATFSHAINTSAISNPAPQAVYQSQRTGTTFSYIIPNLTANTAYTVRLLFAEVWFTSAGKRVFNATINGNQVLANFDIFQAAGGSNIAVAKAFGVNADGSGKITIRFAASVDNATLAGIELISGSSSSAPTPAPAPSPAPASGSWPATGWIPYNGGPLTVPVAQYPAYSSDSASVVNTLWNGRSSDAGFLQAYAGRAPSSSADYTADVLYFGRSGDPVYTISCYAYGGGCGASGQQVHIPRGAFPAGGSDHHIDIRDTVTGKDVLLWEAPVPNGSGGTYSVGWGGVINSNSQGLDAVGATASGVSALWSVRETDLAHNSINHAVLISVNGESSAGYVYPAVGWDNNFFKYDYPKMGAHFWLDVPPSQLPSSCPQYAVSYLTALHKYGAYFVDVAGISHVFGVLAESDMSYTYNGGTSVWGPFMQSVGLQSTGMSDYSFSNCGINMQQHMHILNPPSP